MFASLILALTVQQPPPDPIADLMREMESRRWTPPETTIPKEFVEACQFMFSHGLADPSGGKLRRVTVRYNQSTGHGERFIETVGWVLPELVEGLRYAVLFDGLIYRVTTALEEVRIEDLLENPFDTNYERPQYVGPDPRFNLAVIALLLRVGNTSAAETLFARHSGQPNHTPVARIAVGELVNSHQLRAVGCYSSADDSEAFRHAALIVRNKPAYFIYDLSFSPTQPNDRFTPLPELSTIDLVYQETKRRLSSRRPRFDENWVASLPIDRRIEVLIEYLDEAKTIQVMQPGGVDLANSTIVFNLVSTGERAIPALFEVAESDKRMTRTVSFGRSFFSGRTIHSVRAAAIAAIKEILDAHAIGERPYDTTYQELRDYWEKWKDVPVAERKLFELADEQGSREKWLRAARFLVQRQKPATSIAPWPMGDRTGDGSMMGQSLSESQRQLATELMQKRAISFAPRIGTSTVSNRMMREAWQMAKILHTWNADAAIPTMAQLSREFADAFDSRGLILGHDGEQSVMSLAFASVIRKRRGDPNALHDYLSVIQLYPPLPALGDCESLLAPFFLFPEDPEIRRTSHLFTEDSSTFNPKNITPFPNGGVFSSGLMDIPAFSETALELLADKSKLGEVWFEEGFGHFRFSNGSGGFQIAPEDVSTMQKMEGQKQDFLRGDALALAMSAFEGAPSFNALWPDERKQMAKEEIKKFVEANRGSLYLLNPSVARFRLGDWIRDPSFK